MLLWPATHAGIPVAELTDSLEHRSGLAALAGTPDMRDILDRAGPPAVLPRDVYLRR